MNWRSWIIKGMVAYCVLFTVASVLVELIENRATPKEQNEGQS